MLTPENHDLSPLLQRQSHGLGPIRLKGQPLAGVYLDLRALEATRRLIDTTTATRSIPADRRTLVERATHGEALDAIAQDMGDAWVRFGNEVDGVRNATSTIANLHALAFDRHFGEQLFPDDHGSDGSRLGAADRLVVFDPAPLGPFGQPVQQLALRHHLLAPKLPVDAPPDAVQTLPDSPGFDFTLGGRHYRYSRYGLDRLRPQD